MPTEFSVQVVKLIRKIPKSKVATYGQIAALAGKPHAARGVSWILHSSSKAEKLPWHRVLGAKGRISFPKGSAHFHKQIQLLQREGVELSENGFVDLTESQWSKQPAPERRSTRPKRA